MQNDLRDILVKKLRWSFFGPDHTDEPDELDLMAQLEYEDPGKNYITGILSPQLNSNDDESSDDDSPFSKTGANDSSFGFTFSLPYDFTENIEYGVDFSTYKRKTIDGKEIFQRIPHSFTFEFNKNDIQDKNKIEKKIIEVGKNKDEVQLILTRRTDIEDHKNIIFTLSVVHFGKEESALRPWRSSLFQVRLWTRNPKGFSELPFDSLDLTEDKKQSSLLYRNVHRYAVGHGCGVKWDESSIDHIESTFFPATEVPVFKHKDFESEAISMLKWAKGDQDHEELKEIISSYGKWTETQNIASKELSSDLKKTFEHNEKNVEEVQQRIRNGIALLEKDPKVQLAFQWMNFAMLDQQVRGRSEVIKVEEIDGQFRPGKIKPFDVLDRTSWPIKDADKYGKWRLFQLAFILMCIPDVTKKDQEPPMDLIWFPTGGGKTEAYLGLSAFLLLYERLSGRQDKGVRILMRYTLRLLTAQQFERASSMIMALDDIRKKNEEKLGRTPFQIGLWVGSSVTFNKHGSPREEYTKQARTANAWFSNLTHPYYNRPWPWVLQKCPRCSREFGVKGKDDQKVVFGISRREKDNKLIYTCECSSYDDNRLPILVIDEDIYSELPSMVIATVDKFARLPWNPESSRLLGVNALGPGKHSKVSMIIQDELHLLEGPLGTIVGLYESAIDFLIQRTGATPKRVGSSATLAMAREQCKSLYGLPEENVKVFPPPLLNWDDNYFSYVDHKAKGRKYVGVYANGSPSGKTTQYRLYSSLLQTGGEIAIDHSDEGESHTTLVNYFNSTRDMGQALSLMGDDVPRELRNLARKFEIPTDKQRRLIDINQGLVQLHGNVKSDTVQKDMSRLEIEHKNPKHVHTVLATNMISVGLDVPRLSLMTIIHQPKTMSEYIQASSRIGRGKTPGIVFVVLSARRSRDRSHLEDFVTTHKKMYSLVEPSSLTPFSLSAIERALAGVLASIFRNDPQYGLFGHFSSVDERLVEVVKDFYKKRITIIDPNEWESFSEKFDDFSTSWNRRGYLSFGNEVHPNPQDRPFMVPFLTPSKNWSVRPHQVLQAMRNVDSGIELKQIEQ
jgi:hypothetical protein